jgi:hypothetical protein
LNRNFPDTDGLSNQVSSLRPNRIDGLVPSSAPEHPLCAPGEEEHLGVTGIEPVQFSTELPTQLPEEFTHRGIRSIR